MFGGYSFSKVRLLQRSHIYISKHSYKVTVLEVVEKIRLRMQVGVDVIRQGVLPRLSGFRWEAQG